MQTKIKNISNEPVCVKDPETGEVYCLLSNSILSANSDWPAVRNLLIEHKVVILD